MRIPRYPKKPHSSGQARIRIRGRAIYLGKFGSKESREAYEKVIAEYRATGVAPAARTRAQPKHDGRPTVAALVRAHHEWARERYVKNGVQTSEVRMFKTALPPVARYYGELAADDFGPVKLNHCRSLLIQEGYVRTLVNQHVSRIRRCFKWGISRELVRPETLLALQSLPGLKPGEEGVADAKKVGCAPKDAIAAVQNYVLPPVWAMIQLQLHTAMRPGEACSIRTCDIRQTDPAIPVTGLWIYRPESHKTEHYKKDKIILLGPHAQELLTAWLRPDKPEKPLFSPADGMEWRRERMRVPGSQKRKKKSRPKRKPGEQYRVTSYGHAIRKACRKAEVEHWHPNQLRHNAGTLIRARYGVEVARVILGHSSISTTDIYAEKSYRDAARAILEVG